MSEKKFPTPLEVAFVAKYLGQGDGARAAEEIGITGDTPTRAKQNQKLFAYRALKKPIVRKLIEKKFERFAATVGMKQGHELKQSDLLDEVLTLARTPICQTGDRLHGQVAAYELAAKIAGHITNKVEVNDVTKSLQGKSPDELMFIAMVGRDPMNAEELHRFIHEHNKQRVN